MVKFCWRGTANQINDSDWDYNRRFTDLFPVDQWAKVYGVNNVVDIVVMSYTGTFYSISPKLFAEKMNQYAGDNAVNDTFYVPPNAGAAATGYRANGKEDKKNAPLGGRDQKGEEILRYIDQSEWAGWNGDDNNTARAFLKDTGEFNDTANKWSAIFEDYMYQTKQSKPRDPITPAESSDNWWRYNRLSRLINFINAFSAATSRGYKFFNPDLRSRINYVKKTFDIETHMLVMYLDAKTVSLSWGCFNKDRDSKVDKTVLAKIFQSSSLSDRDGMLRMGTDHCSNTMPDYSVLKEGAYGMGTDIYSPNTRFKAILQPDGNLVVYDITSDNPVLKQNAVWATGTYLRQYSVRFLNKDVQLALVKPILVVQGDGNITMTDRNGLPAWTTSTGGSGVKLGLDNDGVLFAFADNDPTKTIWTSNGGNHKTADWLSIFGALNSDSCSPKDPRNPLSDFDISQKRLAWCKQGNNLIENSDFCGYLTKSGDLGTMDNSSKDVKRAVDDFVKNILCSPDGMKDANDAKRKFCSCFVPYSDTEKTLIANGIPMNCTQRCIQDGYHSLEQPTSCDAKICIMSQDVKNLMDSKFIEQTCNISNGPGPSTTTPTTTPSTPDKPVAPAVSQNKNTQDIPLTPATASSTSAGSTTPAQTSTSVSSNSDGSTTPPQTSTTTTTTPTTATPSSSTPAPPSQAPTTAPTSTWSEWASANQTAVLGFIGIIVIVIIIFAARRRGGNAYPQQYAPQYAPPPPQYGVPPPQYGPPQQAPPQYAPQPQYGPPPQPAMMQ